MEFSIHVDLLAILFFALKTMLALFVFHFMASLLFVSDLFDPNGKNFTKESPAPGDPYRPIGMAFLYFLTSPYCVVLAYSALFNDKDRPLTLSFVGAVGLWSYLVFW